MILSAADKLLAIAEWEKEIEAGLKADAIRKYRMELCKDGDATAAIAAEKIKLEKEVKP